MRIKTTYIFFSIILLLSIQDILISQPANDDCSGAIDLGTIPYCDNTVFSNTNATPSDIGNSNNASCFKANPPQRDIWFKFRVGSTEEVRFILTGIEGQSSKMKNIQVAIYRGGCGFNNMVERNCAVSAVGESGLEFVVGGFTIGENYYLRVDNFNGVNSSGDFNICIKENNIYTLGQDAYSDKCEGILFDSGGENGDYSENEDYLFTICPEGGTNSIQFEFEYYNLNLINQGEFEYDTIPNNNKKNGDILILYNGVDTNYSVFLEINGNAEHYFEKDLIFGAGVKYNNCSNSECITLRFVSDDSLNATGFKFLWECKSDYCSVAGTQKLKVKEHITEDSILNYIIKNGVEGKLTAIKCPDKSYGVFNNSSDDIGFNKGLLLTNGLVKNAIGPNDSGKKSFALKLPGDSDLDSLSALTVGKEWQKSYDACVVEFDIVPYGEEISYKYMFSSEEYHEFVQSKYNDIFGLFISGEGVETMPSLDNKRNMALIPNTNDFVSINTVNGAVNWQYYHSNLGGNDLQYDGMIWDSLGEKHYLIARQKVVPCETYHIKYAIADRADTIYDSGVFIGDLTDGRPDLTVDLSYGFDYLSDNCSTISGIVKFTLPFVLEKDIRFDVEISGTAKRNLDYTSDIPEFIEFKAGDLEKSFKINVIEDDLDEGTEFVIIKLVRNFACGKKELGSVIIEIRDMLDMTINEGMDTLYHCGNDSVKLEVSGVNYVYWTPESYFLNPDIITVSFLPETDEWIFANGRLIDTIFDKCIATDSIFIINSRTDFFIEGDSIRIFCRGNQEVLKIDGNYRDSEIIWFPREIIVGDNHGDSVLIKVDSNDFKVYAKLISNGCELVDSIYILSEQAPELNIYFEPDVNIRICDTIDITLESTSAFSIGDSIIWDIAGEFWEHNDSSIFLKIDRENTIVDIHFIDSIGCKVDTSIVIPANQSDIIFPNAIFLNNEKNKVFKPFNINPCIDIQNFRIFNRWGEKVFDCEDEACAKLGWNAEYRGSEVKPGVYLYIFNYYNINDELKQIKGSFIVLK